MPITQILILIGTALFLRLFWQKPARDWLVLAVSVACLFWLQPALPIRYLSYWLPVATLLITVLSWLLTLPMDSRPTRQDLLTGLIITGLALLAGLTRYLEWAGWLKSLNPPPVESVLLGLLAATLLVGGAAWWRVKSGRLPVGLLGAWGLILILLLLVLKTPALAQLSAQGLRAVMGQNPLLASVLDIRWLGFSYLCFRLLHTIRDRQTGRLPDCDLRTYISYLVFFPSLLAGPIDRLDRFAKEYQAPEIHPHPARSSVFRLRPDAGFDVDAVEASRRLAFGLLKKFALADTLALVTLNTLNAGQVQETGWLWLLVYGYAFQIFFDFSGYTDIAIGMGRLLGVCLPENFNAPYLKPNLTTFWNSWHMSLTQWFRAYYFNPLARWLRMRKTPTGVVLLISQVTTMLLIGLWHGVTVNFVLWGLWHGLGQFLQNRWSEWTRPWFASHPMNPVQGRVVQVFSILFTFHYVALGWVWFVLPDPLAAFRVLLRLFGLGV